MLRPPGLPDYENPPVTEVILGVQFDALTRLMAPHLGLVWTEFKDTFPVMEDHPPIEPASEVFIEHGGAPPAPRLQVQILSELPLPRLFFISQDKTDLIQFQRDRFLRNWRKLKEGDVYPRYETLLESFQAGYHKLAALVARENLGPIVPNQCEITYINQIGLRGESHSEAFEGLFDRLARPLELSDLGKPEDARFGARYIIRDEARGAPIGRLIIAVDPGWRPDGEGIFQLTLIVRGTPASADLDGVSQFMDLGRSHIVESFTHLTSRQMHERWGRVR